jgi:methyl-accepting chemotaxis protein
MGAIAGAVGIVAIAGTVLGFAPDFTGRAFGRVESDVESIDDIRERFEATTGILQEQIGRYERALGKIATENQRGARIRAELAAQLRQANRELEQIRASVAGLSGYLDSFTDPIKGIEAIARRLAEIARQIEAAHVD